MGWRVPDRTANLIQIRIVTKGGRIVSPPLNGVAGDEFGMGILVSRTNDERVTGLTENIDSNISGPVSGVALSEFPTDGDAVWFQEINANTVLEGQVTTGSADDVAGSRGTLTYDATTGNYSVNLASATNASIEVVASEPNYHNVGHPKSGGDYNLVRFKFLPAVLDKAPAAVSS